MKPTVNLRFVEKDIFVPHERVAGVSVAKTIRVLQQQFEEINGKTGEIKSEWRDVPLAKDEL